MHEMASNKPVQFLTRSKFSEKFSSFFSLPCTSCASRGYVIDVGVHLYIRSYVYVCDTKKFEWHFSG